MSVLIDKMSELKYNEIDKWLRILEINEKDNCTRNGIIKGITNEWGRNAQRGDG